MATSLVQLIFNKYVLGFILATLVFGYIYWLRTSINQLEQQKTELSILVERQRLAIVQLKQDVESVLAAREAFKNAREELLKQRAVLTETLYRDMHRRKKSLEQLATKKTTLVQKKINAATENVFKCFEILTNGGDC